MDIHYSSVKFFVVIKHDNRMCIFDYSLLRLRLADEFKHKEKSTKSFGLNIEML